MLTNNKGRIDESFCLLLREMTKEGAPFLTSSEISLACRLLGPLVISFAFFAAGRDQGKVGQFTKGTIRTAMQCDFTTTGPVELTVSQIAFMDALQPYFNYSMAPICGIPQVTLTGTMDDWKKVGGQAGV